MAGLSYPVSNCYDGEKCKNRFGNWGNNFTAFIILVFSEKKKSRVNNRH